ncbi:MAG: AI-2E family transporter [Thermoleophilaceae bacterium]|nr:AI-2E family transporter [Thermoleophilaceae bacterium]
MTEDKSLMPDLPPAPTPTDRRTNPYERPPMHPVSILRVVLVVVAAVLSIYVIYLLRQPISWMVIAGFIAIAVSGPINFLSRWMKRGLAIAIVYVGVVLVPIGMLAALVPPIVEQGEELAQKAPQYAQDVQNFANENKRVRELDDKFDLTAKLEELAQELPSKVGDAAGTLADLGAGIVSGLFAGITILILSIFMVGAAPRWRKSIIGIQSRDRAESLNRLFERVGAAVGNYVAGALIQATVAGVLSYIVLLILGVPYPLALALVIFALDLVPLVGATLGAILVGLVTLFQDFPTATIVWVIWSIVYQQLENNVIQPRIQSRAVAVEPFIVLASVLFGAALFGIAGALMAIPAAASIQIAIREYLVYSGRLQVPDHAKAETEPVPPEEDGEPPPGGEPPAAPA